MCAVSTHLGGDVAEELHVSIPFSGARRKNVRSWLEGPWNDP
jgi:hypothetical protein